MLKTPNHMKDPLAFVIGAAMQGDIVALAALRKRGASDPVAKAQYERLAKR